ncbi:hypothetical protein KEM52_002623 [Ascosphaera acerosa]|nr:hypothetical protein KEM52_002623 [Ascosphaera acerosa]
MAEAAEKLSVPETLPKGTQLLNHEEPLENLVSSYYGGSIDLRRAMAAENEVILALEMNGAQLTPEHGFPVRVVVPGIAGARWVKWLDRITVQAMESPNFYQQHDYKVLPPEVSTWEAAEPYWPLVPAFQAMPVNSIIGMPSSGSVARVSADGVLTVRGVAVPEGDHGPVARVEVSLDDGQTWTDASLHHADETKKWAWVLWSAEVAVPAEARGTKIDILSRATDRGGNTQPRASPWNIRGIGYNGYGEANGVQLE